MEEVALLSIFFVVCTVLAITEHYDKWLESKTLQAKSKLLQNYKLKTEISDLRSRVAQVSKENVHLRGRLVDYDLKNSEKNATIK